METALSKDKKFCECGCGSIIERYDWRNRRERKFKNGHNGRIKEKLFCSICGSDATFIRKSGTLKGRAVWYRDNDRQPICTNCYNYIFFGDYYRERAKQRIKYKDKHIYLDYEPRIGICNWCRAVVPFDTSATELHHDERRYDDSEPLKNTIELCKSCHQKEKWRLGEIIL